MPLAVTRSLKEPGDKPSKLNCPLGPDWVTCSIDPFRVVSTTCASWMMTPLVSRTVPEMMAVPGRGAGFEPVATNEPGASGNSTLAANGLTVCCAFDRTAEAPRKTARSTRPSRTVFRRSASLTLLRQAHAIFGCSGCTVRLATSETSILPRSEPRILDVPYCMDASNHSLFQ